MDTVERSSPKKSSNVFWIVGAFLLSKGAVILKALKAVKYAKFAITAISMSISALLYGFAFGSWYFATGFVLLLLVHEYGHVIAMWKKGVHASAPVFIPFLGAAIFANMPEQKADEAYIGYGGPLIGTIGALLVIAAAFMFPDGSFWSVLLHILGNVGLFINLFNLIPARPLDGGRILHPLGGGVVYCGFFLLLGFGYMLNDTLFVFIALLSLESMPVRPWVRRMLWGILWAVWSAEIIFFSPFWETGEVGVRILGAVFLTFTIVFSILSFAFAWKGRDDPLPKLPGEKQAVSFGVKMKWLGLYVALTAVIVGSMMWHAQHLPKEVRESSLVRFVHEF